MNQLSANKVHGKDVFQSKTFVFGFLGVNLVDVEKSILSTKLADKTKQNWLVKNSQEESNIDDDYNVTTRIALLMPYHDFFP